MDIMLSDQEREILVDLLSRENSELGPEIHHTDDSEFRDQLKERRAVLRGLLERLRSTVPVGT